jgi:exopolyphosphatase/guanosine-5'-triphosphate,3'-diphosphate pyrophosphatase
MIVAAIDIGSNSVRLLIAEIDKQKIKNIIFEKKYTTRLAEDINKTGKLSEEAISRTIKALSDFNKHILKYDVESIKAVATSAVREASNKEEFLKLTEDFCFKIEVIDGRTESLLTFQGVLSGLDLKDKPLLLIDIGGGSTEFVYYNGSQITSYESFKFGVVKLAEIFNFHSKIDSQILKLMEEELDKLILPHLLNDKEIEFLIATAGTPTTLAAIKMSMKEYEPEKINGFIMSKEDIKKIFRLICEKNIEERLKIIGLEKGREDLIIPGTFILLYVMDNLNIDKMIVSDNGLREGVALAAAL